MNGNITGAATIGNGTNIYKPKFEFLNFTKINNAKSKLKLLKPKINASNGAKNTSNLNIPTLSPLPISKFSKAYEESNVNNFNSVNNKNGFIDILKNPKIRFPLKHMNKDDHKNNMKTIMDSTAITTTQENKKLSQNSKKERDLDNKNNSNTTCVTSSHKSDIIPYKEVEKKTSNSNFHKIHRLKTDIITIDRNKDNRHMKTIYMNKNMNNHTINIDANTSSLHSESEYSPTPGNRSINIKNSKSLLLRQNESISPKRQKSFNSKKHGIQIIDQIIRGLSQLKTIIAEDEDDVDDLGGLIKHSAALFQQKSTIDPQTLLISSTTGDRIAIENKSIFKMMKQKPKNQKTIDPDESINVEEDGHVSNLNNDSLIMQIKTEEKSILNRYSEADDGYNSGNNFNTNNNKFRVVQGNTVSRNISNLKLKRLQKGLKNDSNINSNSDSQFQIDKFEYKVVNRERDSANKAGSKIRVNKNLSHYLMNNNSHYNNTQFNLNTTNNTPTNIKPIKLRLNEFPMKLKDLSINHEEFFKAAKRTIKIDNEDFANYEFID